MYRLEQDYIIRATAADGYIRAFAVRTTQMVEIARRQHGLTPVASAALGRTMSAATMMGIDLHGERDSLSIVIKGGGPIGGIIVVADASGNVKGYVDNPSVDLPLNDQGKLDVGGAVGTQGKLTVIKDYKLKEPYIGQVDIATGEIAEDITYYFAVSEQQPSVTALGVLVNPDLTINASGGFIIQPMPGAPDELIDHIEDSLNSIDPISTQISKGMTPEEILEEILGDHGLKINERLEVAFRCDCNRERLESVLISLGREELQDILDTDGQSELVCHYCNKKYLFNSEELRRLIELATM